MARQSISHRKRPDECWRESPPPFVYASLPDLAGSPHNFHMSRDNLFKDTVCFKQLLLILRSFGKAVACLEVPHSRYALVSCMNSFVRTTWQYSTVALSPHLFLFSGYWIRLASFHVPESRFLESCTYFAEIVNNGTFIHRARTRQFWVHYINWLHTP